MSSDLVPSPPQAQEMAQLEGMMGDHGSAYWKGASAELNQARYRDLVSARSGGAPAPAPSPEAAEKAAIEDKMGTAEYWRGPYAERHQSRYRQLLEKGGQAAAPLSTPEPSPQSSEPGVMPLAEMQARFGAGAVAEWQQTGALDAHRERAQETIGGVLQSLGDRETINDFLADFDVLPDAARSAMRREAAIGAPTYVKPADAGEISAFKTLDGAKALIEEWGNSAPRRVAIVAERFNRTVAAIPERERADFSSWWKWLPAEQRMAIFRALAR